MIQTSNRNQRGMAAIIVTLVMMVIISLIVVGFATVSRREQRQSIDQQLSTQAFYAAESGIDDARSVIKDALAAGTVPANKTTCTDATGGYPTGDATKLDETNQVSYSCLKVDATPKSLIYSGVSDNSIVVPVKTTAPLDSIQITWQPSSPPTGTPNDCPVGTTAVFTPLPQWNCKYGVLRTDVVAASGSLTRAGLQSNALTGFFVPSRSGGAGNISYAADKGKPNTVAANCDVAAYTTCRAIIDNLGGGTNFMLRISSIYKTSNIVVTANQSGNPVGISGAQAVIDATGKAQDVLRRIQVRMPLTVASDGSIPNYAIQTNSAICKRFQLSPTYFRIPGDIENGITEQRDTSNPMCNPTSDGTP